MKYMASPKKNDGARKATNKNGATKSGKRGNITPTVNKIFISWAGEYSKKIAIALKGVLEKDIFCNMNLECFVSDVDIASGTDWWDKIKDELKNCQFCIICITSENVRAPWIYYEAGAMVAKDVLSVPFLVNCSVNSLDHTPLTGKQAIKFYDQSQFVKMIKDINNDMELQLSPNHIHLIAEPAYKKLRANLDSVLSRMKDLFYFSEKSLYPASVTYGQRKTVYVSAPMSSVSSDEYEELHKYALELRRILEDELEFTHAESPLFDIENPDKFDWPPKAIEENFANLKKVETIIAIYPKNVPSSTLVELGYGIALSKRVVIFYHEELPYILKEVGQTVGHVNTFHYDRYSDISNIIRRSGMSIFKEVK